MRIIYIKKTLILFILLLFIMSLFIIFFKLAHLPVYKDRKYWENTGSIVWEIATNKKMVALTFDDGPSPTFTCQILDLLKQYNAKGTFFVMGKQAEQYPEIITRQLKEGHEIGNHTYSHREVFQLSEQELEADLKKAHQLINRITGNNMRVFRPTSGFYNALVVKVAKILNYTVVIWTWGQDSRDWTGVSGEQIACKILENIKPGNIVLFHDRGGDHTNTVRALQIILPVLKERGYQFVTVSSLLQNTKKKASLEAVYKIQNTTGRICHLKTESINMKMG